MIILLTLGGLWIDLPKSIPLKFSLGSWSVDTEVTKSELDLSRVGVNFSRDLEIKQGLDLQGGTQVVLRADMGSLADEDRQAAHESATEVIKRRIDLFGVNESVVRTSVAGGEYRIVAELPGVSDVDQALDLIGTTAQLDFREIPEEATESAMLADFVETGLTGEHLERARVEFDQNTSQPVVAIQFNDVGSGLFEEITGRNVGKPVAIFLDEVPVTIPTVNAQIAGGQAVISGDFTTDGAKALSVQLNAGALPVPIEIIEQRNIGATLGRDSVEKSVRAGLIGLSMVMVFMTLYYGRLGVIANVGLIIYGVLTLAVYKLIPVTLTLPGLAGFVLSVGMAVDSNILIFERMKEEIRSGKKWFVAMELGFGRAWDSIKDANVATLITTFILFNPLDWPFLNTSGVIRGFALTLALGIVISLFTGVVVTRTLIRLFYREEIR